MLRPETFEQIVTVAHAIGVEPAALAAVAHIESGLRMETVIEGRSEPLIRFEGHYFDRRLSGRRRERARTEGLASPEAGAVVNPPSQAERWAMLNRAAAIDRNAAYESVSWGVGQVMGAHWAWLGYRDVAAFVAEARSGVEGQLRLMARYIDKAGLADTLRRHDWAAFARGYNGPAYRRNRYDAKLARAYALYAGKFRKEPNATLRLGHRGEAVRSLQSALAKQGHAVVVDGIFGRATEQAVRNFQETNGLAADGIAGPLTFAKLRAEAGTPSLLSRLVRFLRRFRPALPD